MNSTFYVSFSESGYNINIKDSRVVGNGNFIYAESEGYMPNIASNPYEHFAIQVLGTGEGGFTNTYLLDRADMGQLATKALTDSSVITDYLSYVIEEINDSENVVDLLGRYLRTIWDQAVSIGADVKEQGFMNAWSNALNGFKDSYMEGTLQPYENIVGLRTLPVSVISFFEGNVVPLKLGDFDTGIAARLVSNPISPEFSVTLSIPWHYNDFRRESPYTQLYLYIPYAGMFTLDSSILRNSTSITLKYKIGIDGTISGIIVDSNGNFVTDMKFCIGVGMATGVRQEAWSDIRVAAGLQSALGAGVSGFAEAGMAGFVVGAVSGGIAAIPTMGTAQQSVRGSDSVICYYSNAVKLICRSAGTIDPSNFISQGRPRCLYTQLGALSGYVKCEGAHIVCPGKLSELQKIDNYLNGGIYIE